jgi:uncharacterized glyoxalase superfamily protein PhnB/uncharacterized protein YndB with AHSA1/START domain
MGKKESNTKDREISTSRLFNAPIELVWEMWANPEHIKNWWGPNGFTNTIHKMDFQEEGEWNLTMHGPDGTNYPNRSIYKEIIPFRKIVFEHFNPHFFTTVLFESKGEETYIEWKMLFDTSEMRGTVIRAHKADEGQKQNIDKLEQYLSAKFKLRNQLKTNTMSRTSTYLNFPGNTEEAFNFYKSVFGTQFGGKGIQRFGDIPAETGHPPVADAVKKMVLHVELPILGGHILMATDAPKEMGMSVTRGNNMHICLEPETKAETKKLFDALSQGGNIVMPLADMFFGAYFGECTDKFGINWMFNCIEKK